jgi:hypothetical protein
MASEFKKLIIESFADAKRDGKADDTYTVMFNPSTYSINHEMMYKVDEGKNSTGSAQDFLGVKPKTISLDIMVDGSGTSGEKLNGADVDQDIARFFEVCALYNGDKHRLPFLRLAWGALILDCVMSSAKVNYTLFNRDGTALRAKISASFKEQMDNPKQALKKKDKSPDLTHYRTVIDGDTLQLMSHRIYGDPSYYMEVARVNKLNDFRTLEPGAKLYFPPIDKTSVSS